MKYLSVAFFAAGIVAFLASMFMPANRDWLGFFWAMFAFDVTMRGPNGIADYALFALVSAGNALVVLALVAYPFARSWWARFVAHLLGLAAAGAVIACFKYRPDTWAVGYYVWCAAVGMIAIALYANAAAQSVAARALASVGRDRPEPLRRSGT